MTLISRVMHTEDDAHPTVAHVAGEDRPQVDGRERGVPVVRVKDDRVGSGDAWNRGERGHAEACITTRVVGIVGARWAVEIWTVEVLRALDEVHFRTDARVVGAFGQAPKPRRLDSAADLDAERRADGLDLRRGLAHLGIE